MYPVAAFIHLIAAVVWIGGMLFLGFVLVPVTRGMQQQSGVGVLTAAAQRFRIIAWVSLVILIGTGLWLLVERGLSPLDIVTGRGRFFVLLQVKVTLVSLVVVLSALHDFVLGPRVSSALRTAGEGSAGDRALLRQRKLLSWFARVSVVLVLSIVLLGVFLVRGLPS